MRQVSNGISPRSIWVLFHPWEGDQRQLRLDFAYNFTGFGCGTLAFTMAVASNMVQQCRSHHGPLVGGLGSMVISGWLVVLCGD